ncbi:hypothetical protein H6503_06255 [Candidatus Woesearchaeota archaeon]|nr:hypothetical protein [Candidatus Woesearchaeota archaeon]
MYRRFLSLSGAVLLAAAFLNLVFADLSSKPFQGFCFGPFRTGQSPETGSFPSEAQIRQDLDIIKQLSPKIRTYGVDRILGNIPGYCKDIGLDIYPGTWINNASYDAANIQLLIDVGNQNNDNIKGLVVGNEYLYRNSSSLNTLIAHINNVRNQTGRPVGASEQWHIWRDYPALADAVDFIFVHTHPYWEGQHINNAAAYAMQRRNEIAALYSGKPITVSEVGWPSAGGAYGNAVPSITNQKKFLEDFVLLAEQNDADYMLFEIFDEPWKTYYSEVEGHWGVMDAYRQSKSPLTGILQSDVEIKSMKSGSMDVSSYEDSKYVIQHSFDGKTWSNIDEFAGAVGTNTTNVALPDISAREFFRYFLRL